MSNNCRMPPPWLINMQRYGPPPSYPGLKIPGINSPIPAGCRFGYGPEEWGKPPLDQEGNSLYVGVFTVQDKCEEESENESTEFTKTFEWGKIEEIDEEEVNEVEEEEGTRDTDDTNSVFTCPYSQMPKGAVIPNTLNLRKDGISSETPISQILKKNDTDLITSIMNTDHIYSTTK